MWYGYREVRLLINCWWGFKTVQLLQKGSEWFLKKFTVVLQCSSAISVPGTKKNQKKIIARGC